MNGSEELGLKISRIVTLLMLSMFIILLFFPDFQISFTPKNRHTNWEGSEILTPSIENLTFTVENLYISLQTEGRAIVKFDLIMENNNVQHSLNKTGIFILWNKGDPLQVSDISVYDVKTGKNIGYTLDTSGFFAHSKRKTESELNYEDWGDSEEIKGFPALFMYTNHSYVSSYGNSINLELDNELKLNEAKKLHVEFSVIGGVKTPDFLHYDLKTEVYSYPFLQHHYNLLLLLPSADKIEITDILIFLPRDTEPIIFLPETFDEKFGAGGVACWLSPSYKGNQTGALFKLTRLDINNPDILKKCPDPVYLDGISNYLKMHRPKIIVPEIVFPVYENNPGILSIAFSYKIRPEKLFSLLLPPVIILIFSFWFITKVPESHLISGLTGLYVGLVGFWYNAFLETGLHPNILDLMYAIVFVIMTYNVAKKVGIDSGPYFTGDVKKLIGVFIIFFILCRHILRILPTPDIVMFSTLLALPIVIALLINPVVGYFSAFILSFTMYPWLYFNNQFIVTGLWAFLFTLIVHKAWKKDYTRKQEYTIKLAIRKREIILEIPRFNPLFIKGSVLILSIFIPLIVLGDLLSFFGYPPQVLLNIKGAIVCTLTIIAILLVYTSINRYYPAIKKFLFDKAKKSLRFS